MFQFPPRSEEEVRNAVLVPAGRYQFVVLKAVERVSKKTGQPLIELILDIIDSTGYPRRVYDYLTLSPKMAYKIRHFCMATGLMERYDTGALSATDCVGRTGIVDVEIQKTKEPNFPDRNSVKDYIVTESNPPATNDPEFNDDLTI